MTAWPVLKNVVVYTLLAGGALLFSIPFVWMASTSFKVDREMFTSELQLIPISPTPQPRSPYVDEAYYPSIDDDWYQRLSVVHQEALLAAFASLACETGFPIPSDLDRRAAERQIAVGLYRKLSRRLPPEVWDRLASGATEAARSHADNRIDDGGLAAALLEIVQGAAAGDVDRRMVEAIFARVHRRLRIGQLRVRSVDLEEEELGAGLPFSERLENLTPEAAGLRDRTQKGLEHAAVSYDFQKGDRFILSKTFTLGFDAARLQRIQLYLKPDDTWHELYLTVEKQGKKYVAERPVVLANFNWMNATWQEPGPDDHSTKIKTWTLLKEAVGESSPVRDPRSLRLTFEVRRSGQLGAWWNKFRMNYLKVLDYIPFWRYVRVSLFLVIVRVVLTLFIASFVAYAFARLQWPGRDLCFVLMLATMMIPFQVTMIPRFLIWKHLGAYNTLTPLWLGPAFGSAFFIFLMRQFLRGIPRDLEDAARIDGCGFLRIYWHIMLPLIKPSLAAVAIFTFMATWNDFMGPLIYIADQRLYPLAFGLYAFSVQVNNDPALTMAASLLMTLPVVVIFFFAQKYFIQGITLTGIKG